MTGQQTSAVPAAADIRTVLVTGGSGPSGVAVSTALVAAGFRVVSIGSDRARSEQAAAISGATAMVCDLEDAADVEHLRERVMAASPGLAGIIHLVGGWRGGADFTSQSDSDWDFMVARAVTTLRNVTRTFHHDLATQEGSRFVMVSSTAVGKPTAKNANYAAAKAAAESWTLSLADSFAANNNDSAAVVLVVKSLVDDAQRTAQPERRFPGATDVHDLASAIVRLFDTPGHEINGHRITLAP